VLHDAIGFSLKKAVEVIWKVCLQNVTTENLRWSKKSLRLWLGQIPKSGLSHQSLTIIQLMFYWIKIKNDSVVVWGGEIEEKSIGWKEVFEKIMSQMLI
jgi:hypothetical protein